MYSNNKKRIFPFLTIFVILTGCSTNNRASDYQLVYKSDKEGKALIGSKETLINAVRLGASIKIGWGSQGEKHTIEHLSEPIWIAIIDQKEVIAHLDPQILSEIDWNNQTATYSDSVNVTYEWRVAITTKGEFDAIWYDRKEHRISKRVPQNHVMSWYVKGIDINEDASPLFSHSILSCLVSYLN